MKSLIMVLFAIISSLSFYVNSLAQCDDFTDDKSSIYLKDITYYWAPGGNYKAIESISYSIVNPTDIAFDNLQYKITIKDPKGKILYSKTHVLKDKIYSRNLSYKQSIFFDKALKSNWGFQASTHPLFFEITNLRIDKKTTVAFIAQGLRRGYRACSNNQKVEGYKLMLKIYPDLYEEDWGKESDVNYVIMSNPEYFDIDRMPEVKANKERLSKIESLEKKGDELYHSGQYKSAIETYQQAIQLIDRNNEKEKNLTENNLYSMMLSCYGKLQDYEMMGDLQVKRCPEMLGCRNQIADYYYRSSSFTKGFGFFYNILFQPEVYNHKNIFYIGPKKAAKEDWDNLKRFIDKIEPETERSKYMTEFNKNFPRLKFTPQVIDSILDAHYAITGIKDRKKDISCLMQTNMIVDNFNYSVKWKMPNKLIYNTDKKPYQGKNSKYLFDGSSLFVIDNGEPQTKIEPKNWMMYLSSALTISPIWQLENLGFHFQLDEIFPEIDLISLKTDTLHGACCYVTLDLSTGLVERVTLIINKENFLSVSFGYGDEDSSKENNILYNGIRLPVKVWFQRFDNKPAEINCSYQVNNDIGDNEFSPNTK